MKCPKQLQLSAIFAILSALLLPKTSFGSPLEGGPQRHPINTPTHNASPFNWQALTDKDITDFRYEFLPLGKSGQINPKNELITPRLNNWLQRIHQGWTDTLPKTVPPPMLVLVNSADSNAWVTWIPVCLDAKLEVEIDGVPDVEAKKGALFESEVLSPLEPPFTMGAPVRRHCIDSSNSKKVKDFIKEYNQKKGGCELSLKTESPPSELPTIVVQERSGAKEKCLSRTGAPISFKRANKVAFRATGAAIMVTTGLIAEMKTEEQLLAVLAHELSHYYRSHAIFAFSGANSPYNYFYQQKEIPTKGTPIRLSNIDPTMAKDIQSDFQSLVKNDPLRMDVEKQKYSGRLSHFLIDKLINRMTPYCQKNECSEICLDAMKDAGNRFGTNFMTTSMRKEERPKFLQYERDITSCAHSFELKSPAGQDFLKSITNDFKQSNAWFDPTTLKKIETLGDFLKQVNTLSTQRDLKSAHFIQQVQNLHLGFYTDEQEADQYAAEMLSRIGVDPINLVELHLSQGKLRQQKFGQYDWLRYHQIDMEKCATLHKNQWLDSFGHYAFAPLGDLAVPHRGTCYRVFDTDREIQVHGDEYKDMMAKAPPKLKFTESWEDVRKEAEDLNKTIIGPGGVPPT